MVSILQGVINLFRKKNSKKNEKEFQENYKTLKYTGNEQICMACNYPIHSTEKKRKVNKQDIHQKCFRRLKKMVLNGESVNGF